jgi:hypothetical protein
VVNKLQKQMSELQAEKNKLVNLIETDGEHILRSIAESLNKLKDAKSNDTEGQNGEDLVLATLTEQVTFFSTYFPPLIPT